MYILWHDTSVFTMHRLLSIFELNFVRFPLLQMRLRSRSCGEEAVEPEIGTQRSSCSRIFPLNNLFMSV